jgi:hypothetical protein
MTPQTYTDPTTARRYVDIVTSLSELGTARFGRPLVLANYTDVAPSLTSLDAVDGAIGEVAAVVEGMRDGHPRAYLQALLRGSRTVASILRGEDRPYRELVQGILEIDHQPIPSSEVDRLRAELHEGLGLLGYDGPLERQVPAWLEATSLTGDAVIEFGQGILGDARRDTERRVLELPPGEGVDSFTGIRDVHYSGRSQYTGGFRGWLHFNVDKQWQRDLFVHVLCHEAYPGHQTFYALWDWLYQQGRWPVEAAYYQLNNPTNAVFEGGPESAMHFLGWDDGDAPEAVALRVAVAYMDLGRIAMNNACLWCNNGEMTRAQAVDLMVEHFVLRDDAERAYQFFTDDLARTNYAQYYYGRRIVKLAYERFERTDADRERFFDLIYRTPHTTSTFVQAVAEASGAPFDPFSYR